MGSQQYEKENRINSGLSRYEGAFGTAELVHLLKRTLFGAGKKDIDHCNKKKLPAIIDELLDGSEPLPLPTLNDYDEINLQGVPWGTTWVDKPFVAEDDMARLISFWKWTMGTFIHQGRTLRE